MSDLEKFTDLYQAYKLAQIKKQNDELKKQNEELIRLQQTMVDKEIQREIEEKAKSETANLKNKKLYLLSLIKSELDELDDNAKYFIKQNYFEYLINVLQYDNINKELSQELLVEYKFIEGAIKDRKDEKEYENWLQHYNSFLEKTNEYMKLKDELKGYKKEYVKPIEDVRVTQVVLNTIAVVYLVVAFIIAVQRNLTIPISRFLPTFLIFCLPAIILIWHTNSEKKEYIEKKKTIEVKYNNDTAKIRQRMGEIVADENEKLMYTNLASVMLKIAEVQQINKLY